MEVYTLQRKTQKLRSH